ncbi:hypothetical protein PHAVU_011G038300 [Phaseolus vulgaris]
MLLHDQPMEEVLVQILRAAWLAATLPIVIASLPIPNLSFLRRTLIGFAGRGKIMQSSSQKFTIPQRLFLHFYAVAFLWTTLLLVATWAYAYSMVPLVAEPFSYSTITSFLTGGSTIRTDSYKLRQSPSARMHVIGYLTGLFFYIAAPLSLCGDCAVEVFNFVANLVTEFIVKGKNQMQVTEFEIFQILNPLFRLGWKHWIGTAVFLWGWIHQYHCHKILGSLRHSTQAEEYVIPQGDWFEIVSSPHYLSEIVIYASFVVATGGSNLTIWLLFAFVVANLSFAAVETHKWLGILANIYPC